MRLALALALFVAGCADGAPPAAVEGGHPTVVSLNPCTDALAYELAGEGQLLALSHYSRDPASSSINIAKAQRLPVTGGTVEEVLALDPDLVIAGSFLPPSTRRALEDLGIRVETFGIASTVAESEEQVRRMAALLGQAGKGEALVQRIDIAVAKSRAKRGAKTLSVVLWQPGGIVPGDQTLIGELLRIAGFSSHSAERGMGQADYLPLERVLADPPDLLLVAGEGRAQHHPALSMVKGIRIAEFDPSLLYCGGPTIIRAADRLADIRMEAS